MRWLSTDPSTARYWCISGRIAEQVRIRVLRRFAHRGLSEPDDVGEMLAWQNSGFLLGTAL